MESGTEGRSFLCSTPLFIQFQSLTFNGVAFAVEKEGFLNH